MKPVDPKNTNPIYTISPSYRLVAPSNEERPTPRRADRRLDTPRGSAVRRHDLPW